VGGWDTDEGSRPRGREEAEVSRSDGGERYQAPMREGEGARRGSEARHHATHADERDEQLSREKRDQPRGQWEEGRWSDEPVDSGRTARGNSIEPTDGGG
jgi:hypothetical protein